jgi:hypothetical protein
MKDPQEALAAARAAAGATGAIGGDEDASPWSLDEGTVSTRRLAEWAVIEPEAAHVYSTRRLGRPITVVKRLLVRLLRQYIGQMSAQQSRFNAQVAAHVMRLEQRVAELEEAAADRDRPPA